MRGTHKRSVKHRALLAMAPLPIIALTLVTAGTTAKAAPATGYVEICKQAVGPFISGWYDFTVTAGGVSKPAKALVGQCSGPIAVTPGAVNVTEAAVANTTVARIDVVRGTGVTRNVAARSVNFTVAAGPSNMEAVVTYTNRAVVGQIKVCKALTANAGGLNGSSWHFNLTSRDAGEDSVTVVAGNAGDAPACTFSKKPYPIGAVVNITEASQNNVQLDGVIVQPAANNAGSTQSVGKIRVSDGVTTVTFVNRAYGTLQICKYADDESTQGTSWQFNYSLRTLGDSVTVPAGGCSQPIALQVGNWTVTEVTQPNYHLASVSANHGLLSGPKTNPALVHITFGGANPGGNEVLLSFHNAVNTAQFKMCKESPEASLQQHTFHFDANWTVNGYAGTTSADLKPGECSLPSAPIPVVNKGGTPVLVTVTEKQDDATIVVSSIVVTGDGHAASSDNTTGTSTINLGSLDGGVTTVTYTNVRTAA